MKKHLASIVALLVIAIVAVGVGLFIGRRTSSIAPIVDQAGVWPSSATNATSVRFAGSWEPLKDLIGFMAEPSSYRVHGECEKAEMICSVALFTRMGSGTGVSSHAYKVSTWNEQFVIADRKSFCGQETITIDLERGTVKRVVHTQISGLGSPCGGCLTPEFQTSRLLDSEKGNVLEVDSFLWEARQLKHNQAQVTDNYLGGNWTYPSMDKMEASFPDRAKNDEVEGTVTIDCAINSNGRVTGCNILSESPQGYGFGEATTKLFMQYAKVSLPTVGRQIRDGDRKKFTYKWSFY